MAFDKQYLFRQARFEGVSMSELGRRGAARKAALKKRPKVYESCKVCGGTISGTRCLNSDF